jgi:hypothetical protein
VRAKGFCINRTVLDTAPLIALIDAGQGESHRRCVETYRTISTPMLTTWCCFTEAMYFLYQLRGWSAQDTLWQFVDSAKRRLCQREALFLHTADLNYFDSEPTKLAAQTIDQFTKSSYFG